MSTRVLVSGAVLAQRRSGVRRFAENVLPRVAAALDDDGGELALLEPREGTGLATGNAIRSIASNIAPGSAWRRLLAEPRALREIWRTAEEADRPFDWLVSGHLPQPFVPGARQVHLVHDLRVLTNLVSVSKRLTAPRFLRRALTRSEAIVCVSASVEREVLAFAPNAPTRVLGHGGDHLPLFERKPEPFVLAVGHLEPRKNLELALEAWSLDAGLPDLVVVGDGPAQDSLARTVRRRGLAARVRLVGSLDDRVLAQHYARAACALFPSRLEGFGIGLLEARRAGAPLAASAIPAHLELLGAEDDRFAPDEPSDCVRAVRRAIEREGEPQDVPTWSEAAARWTAFFRELA